MIKWKELNDYGKSLSFIREIEENKNIFHEYLKDLVDIFESSTEKKLEWVREWEKSLKMSHTYWSIILKEMEGLNLNFQLSIIHFRGSNLFRDLNALLNALLPVAGSSEEQQQEWLRDWKEKTSRMTSYLKKLLKIPQEENDALPTS